MSLGHASELLAILGRLDRQREVRALFEAHRNELINRRNRDLRIAHDIARKTLGIVDAALVHGPGQMLPPPPLATKQMIDLGTKFRSTLKG